MTLGQTEPILFGTKTKVENSNSVKVTCRVTYLGLTSIDHLYVNSLQPKFLLNLSFYIRTKLLDISSRDS